MSKNSENKFKKDLLVFKNVKALCAAALLSALCVVIAYICKSFTITPSVRITFESLPLILSGYIFGPWVGFLTGVVADITSTSASYGIGGINPILTLGAGSVGLIAGIVSHYIIPKKTTFQIFAATFISHFIGNMIIKTAGLYIYYETPLPEILTRIGVYTAVSVAEAFILTALLKNQGISKAIGRLKL